MRNLDNYLMSASWTRTGKAERCEARGCLSNLSENISLETTDRITDTVCWTIAKAAKAKRLVRISDAKAYAEACAGPAEFD